MDLTTLLVRANDAIDTVIRRDESTETGDHLQPCIEGKLTVLLYFSSSVKFCASLASSSANKIEQNCFFFVG